MLEDITDRRVREQIRDRIDGLAREPNKQGEPLTRELAGYRSLRAVLSPQRSLSGLNRELDILLRVRCR